jgi:anti-sigma factor ChrR (cupin superfamily)
MGHLSVAHPGIADLFRYRFGELSPPQEKAVAAHLSACDACRLELHRLSAASDAVPAPGAADQRKLMSRLRAWQAGPATADRTGEALKRRVALEIAPYVGSRAADSILQPVVEDGRNLLSSVSPLLTMFLGRRATEHLVSHVVEHAIVRT